jgi:hypothetical protein
MPFPKHKTAAPFPWYGGKVMQSDMIWARFGDPTNYVEPFFGSGGVLLNRPSPHNVVETINDLEGFVVNFWRAVRDDPERVAWYADSPPADLDLWARHDWLVRLKAEGSLVDSLQSCPDFYDAKIAGWWVWGVCCWIGSGWCFSTSRQRIHAGNSGMGVHSASTFRQRIHAGNAGMGVHSDASSIDRMMRLSQRMRRVRILCGDWSKAVQSGVIRYGTITGVYLDPPYSDAAKRKADLYSEDSLTVADDVRKWCAENGDDPKLRIALAGYEGEHEELERIGWAVEAWKPRGLGYASQAKHVEQGRENVNRERVWFSPHCLKARASDLPLFASKEVDP